MPYTIREADANYALDWSKWPVPQMPDLPIEPWAGVQVFWKEAITDRPVDAARTAALVNHEIPIGTHGGDKPWEGSSYGMPFQIIDSRSATTKVWDLARPITWNWWTPTLPIVNVPLPYVVRIEGDPNGSSDLHWYGFDPKTQVLYESIVTNKSWVNNWKTFFTTDWCVGYSGGGPGIIRWDCTKPVNAPGQPTGVVGGGVPQFPMIVRWDEIKKGRINHAVFGVLPNYSPERVGPAKGSDGTFKNHPVRGGERLRLKREAVERFALGTPGRVIAEACWEYGWVQADKNSHIPTAGQAGVGGGGFPITQDSRWVTGEGQIPALGEWKTMLTDWEVVQS